MNGLSGLSGLLDLLGELANTQVRRFEPANRMQPQNFQPPRVSEVPAKTEAAPADSAVDLPPEEKQQPVQREILAETPVFTREQLVSGLVMAEILGKPVAYRRSRGRYGLG